MERYPHTNSSSSGAAFIIAILLVIVTMGLLLVIGGLFFFRTTALRQEALIQREQALVSEAQAQKKAMDLKLAEQARASTANENRQGPSAQMLDAQPAAAKTQELPLTLHGDGSLDFGGQTLTISDLKSSLLKVANAEDKQIRLQIQVDPECDVKHVVDVTAICEDAGISSWRLSLIQ